MLVCYTIVVFHNRANTERNDETFKKNDRVTGSLEMGTVLVKQILAGGTTEPFKAISNSTSFQAFSAASFSFLGKCNGFNILHKNCRQGNQN